MGSYDDEDIFEGFIGKAKPIKHGRAAGSLRIPKPLTPPSPPARLAQWP